MNYKKLLIESGIRMASSGLTIGTWGNISIRDPETGLVYLTPSAMPYDTIQEDDVVVCKVDGTVVEGTRKPTIEKDLHLSIMANRSDINAIIHTHPLYSMVYAVQGKDIPLYMDEAAQSLGDTVVCAEYALPGSPELAVNVTKALGDKSYACLVHSHGAVCAGADINKAFNTATVLEITANILQMVEATGGKPVGFTPDIIKTQQDFVKNCYGQGK